VNSGAFPLRVQTFHAQQALHHALRLVGVQIVAGYLDLLVQVVIGGQCWDTCGFRINPASYVL
jgi:hypothetical protein